MQDKIDKSLLIYKNEEKSNFFHNDDNIHIHGDIEDFDAWVYMIHKLILVLVCFWKTVINVAESFFSVEILKYNCNLDNTKLQVNISGLCKYNCVNTNCFLIKMFCVSVYFIISNTSRPLQEIRFN